MNKDTLYRILNSKIFIVIVILVVLGSFTAYLGNRYFSLKNQLSIANQNQSALNDSLRVSTNKVGELVYSKQILVANHIKDIKNLNSEMLKEFKKIDGKVHELTKIVAGISHDTVIIDNTKLLKFPNGDSGLAFNYSKIYDAENYRIIEGVSRFKYDSISNVLTPLSTLISKDEIKFDLVQGLRTTKDGKVEVFATSSYPGFKVAELNSMIIDPKKHPSLTKFTKKNKFGLSLYGGFGLTANLNDYKVIIGPQIGGGLTYNIW